MPNDIYTIYNINKSKLKRDYIKNPLQLLQKRNNKNRPYREYEYIEKDDLYYLYINCKLSTIILGKEFFKIKPDVVKKQLNFYNIIKSKEQIQYDRKYTNKLKYGVDNVMKLEFIKQKMYKTNYKKYNAKSSMQNDNIKNKSYQTKTKNKSFNTSKPEEEIYKLLCQKYKIVKRQYKSKKYPFACDFYIPDEDLYIEYQGFKSHNYEPYNINNIKHQEKVQKWIEYSQHNKAYLGYLKVWTITDPLKRQLAKDNNIKWIEFFNMKQFINWYFKKEE